MISWDSSQKLTLFTMAPNGNLLKKCKISRFPYIFCISTLGISFSFKCMKTIVKTHQMVNFEKNVHHVVLSRSNFKVDFHSPKISIWCIY